MQQDADLELALRMSMMEPEESELDAAIRMSMMPVEQEAVVKMINCKFEKNSKIVIRTLTTSRVSKAGEGTVMGASPRSPSKGGSLSSNGDLSQKWLRRFS